MVKVSKAPSVAVQERLKLSGVTLETFKFPISGSPAAKGEAGEKKQIDMSKSPGLCCWVEVNRTIAGSKDLIGQGYGETKQYYQSVPVGGKNMKKKPWQLDFSVLELPCDQVG